MMPNYQNQITQFVQSIEQEKLRDLRPILQVVSAMIQSDFDKNFESEGRWDGNRSNIGLFSGGNMRWEPLSRKTLYSYAHSRTKRPNSRILWRSGVLQRSIQVAPNSRTGIRATAATPYAAIHQEGGYITTNAREGSAKWKASLNKNTGKYSYRFAKSKAKGKNVIERKFKVKARQFYMPPRPYMTLTPEDMQEIVNTMCKYIVDM